MMPLSDRQGARIIRAQALGRAQPFALNELIGQRPGQHQSATESAFEQGYQEGLKQGEAQAQAHWLSQQQALEQQLGASLTQHVDQLAQSISREFDQACESMAQQLTTLSLNIAQKVIGAQPTLAPESVLEVVHDCLEQLAPNPLRGRLLVHPDDFDLVHARCATVLERQGLSLVAHASVKQRGGCKLEHPLMDLDACIETRWARMIEPLVASSPDLPGAHEPS
jgi:flagellar assembly protein FliH